MALRLKRSFHSIALGDHALYDFESCPTCLAMQKFLDQEPRFVKNYWPDRGNRDVYRNKAGTILNASWVTVEAD